MALPVPLIGATVVNEQLVLDMSAEKLAALPAPQDGSGKFRRASEIIRTTKAFDERKTKAGDLRRQLLFKTDLDAEPTATMTIEGNVTP